MVPSYSDYSEAIHLKTIRQYIDVFNKNTLQTLIDATIKAVNGLWKISPSQKLYEKLDTLMNFELENLELLMSAKPNIKQNFGHLHNCLNKSQCQGLQELVNHLGNCFQN